MKIAFVANTSWNIFNFRKGLVSHFIALGNQVLVLSPEDEYTKELVGWGVKWLSTPLNGTGKNPLGDLRYLRILKKYLRQEMPDVILSYTIKSNIYCCFSSRSLHIPVICNVSGLGTVFLVQSLSGKVALQLYRRAFKHAAHVFFQNQDDLELFISKVNLDPSRLGVLPGSGIDLSQFQYVPPKFEGPTKFLMISRLIIEKGVRDFAAAAAFFSSNPNATFTLVGRFDSKHSRTINQDELKIWQANGLTYLNHSNEIQQLIQDHEVVVLPSYREGTPRTLLEGAAVGRVLLASNVPGCKEVIDHEKNGFLFEVKNPDSLIDAINKYMSTTKEQRKEMSEASRALVESRFDEKVIIQSYEKVIHEIMCKS
ncbi:MAG: glycosyltransferase family 4 protein [Bacteroidota bacterium]